MTNEHQHALQYLTEPKEAAGPAVDVSARVLELSSGGFLQDAEPLQQAIITE